MNKPANFDDARRMLVELLRQDDDGPITGMEDLNEQDQIFLVSSCSAVMLETAICMVASFRESVALEGLDVLVKSMRDNIITRCKNVS